MVHSIDPIRWYYYIITRAIKVHTSFLDQETSDLFVYCSGEVFLYQVLMIICSDDYQKQCRTTVATSWAQITSMRHCRSTALEVHTSKLFFEKKNL